MVLVIPLIAGMIFFMVTGASSRIAAGLSAQAAQMQPNQEIAPELGKPKDVAMQNQVSSEALLEYIFCTIDGRWRQRCARSGRHDPDVHQRWDIQPSGQGLFMELG